MPRKRHRLVEIIRKLRQVEAWQNEWQTIAQVFQKLELLSRETGRWRYPGPLIAHKPFTLPAESSQDPATSHLKNSKQNFNP